MQTNKTRYVRSDHVYMALQVIAWAPVMGPYFAVFVEMLGLIGPGPPLLYSPNQDV